MGSGRGRGSGRESQADFILNEKPDVGLNPTTLSHPGALLMPLFKNCIHSNYCVVRSHCQLSVSPHIKHLFVCLMAIHVSSSVKCLLKCWVLFIKLGYLIMLGELFTSSGSKYFVRHMFCKYFLTICCLPFHVLKS